MKAIKKQDNGSFAELIGLNDIAKAETDFDLKWAIENSIARFQKQEDNRQLEKLKESTRKFLEKPSDEKLRYDFALYFNEASKLISVRNGNHLEDSVHNLDKPSVDEVRNNIIQEYRVQKLSEMLIVDLAVNAYFRSLRVSRAYIALVQNKDGSVSYGDQQKTNLIKELGKQIETANNQFFTALTFLKELRHPPVKVKIQTKEAYIAQNQQINKTQQK
ncbi:hypothetical protein HY612_03650 [Candidatus Roizmanbacteria bacterium]|nr:hypothetical protein [Candidatus Roizmanbacteria bacterium]